MKQALYVLMGVLAGFLLAGVVFFISRLPSGETIALQPAPTIAPIAVDVIGAVTRPGLYKFPEGSRVQDAIDASGGLLADAETTGINLAARLEDGQQLNIPYKNGTAPAAATEAPLFSYSSPNGTPEPTQGPSSDAELIDINKASLDQLKSLGIVEGTAQYIMDHRPWGTIEDIVNVPGMNQTTFDNIKSRITVGN